ncbi:hypothetical protein FDA77_19080 [Clostridium botulinum]|uniref:hypothetical protein n=1 Tax=Clostridium botulinum TaxID=1491 RepID=UPI0013FC6178|nr:hypothetical protein [Clostridium botulinum]MBY6888783.1 hypothetical protein [Clostridium botulinum]NFI47925.1 hypothetical protein [Clostridium botulinum]NFJ91932.1 hypothetical protein [Clostridium botulinum]NFO72153.1 hypothetical protein [Clostridium botulinum]HBJ2609702.1 hypothetical protein [Clostridium botulinum]
MTKLEIILFITAAISVVTTMVLSKQNNKLMKHTKNYKCNLGKVMCGEECCYNCEDRAICRASCNGNPLMCGNSREE